MVKEGGRERKKDKEGKVKEGGKKVEARKRKKKE